MTTVFWFFGILILLGTIVLLGCCKVASNADRQSEQIYKNELLKRKVGE
jgi:hypothetical protein